MTRLKAALIVFMLWAAIYLPGLGSTELKGEEGRRILPAITMLETGNWLVPYVGGKPFLRKPPLMNWLIALSFKATGVRNEWTARLPSAFAVLAMSLTIVGLASGNEKGRGERWMNPSTALTAAIMAMSSFGLLSKARFAGAEIEGVYVPLFGIAMTCWLAWWSRGASPWLTWTVPFVFLGIGALAKGPLHVLFFYAIAIVVVARSRSWRALLHPAHLAGIILMTAIFAAWAVPYHRTEAASGAGKVWKDQMANRVVENRFEWGSYLSNIPRGVGDLLPWLILAPGIVQRIRRGATEEQPEVISENGCALFKSTVVACAAIYAAVLLIPGMLPRYAMPLAIPLALGSAVFLVGQCRILVLKAGCALGALSILYAIVAIPFITRKDDLRPMAVAINSALPSDAELTIYDPGYQPVLFYVRSPQRYAPYLEDVPSEARFVLARAKDRKKFAEKRPDLKVTHEFRRKDDVELLLLEPVIRVPAAS